MTPDGKTYVYGLHRTVGYLVDGLKQGKRKIRY